MAWIVGKGSDDNDKHSQMFMSICQSYRAFSFPLSQVLTAIQFQV